MAITWDQLPLTAQQQAAMQSFAALAATLGPGGGGAGVPTATLSQAKAAKVWMTELRQLVEPAQRGIQYTIEYLHRENAKAFDEANP